MLFPVSLLMAICFWCGQIAPCSQVQECCVKSDGQTTTIVVCASPDDVRTPQAATRKCYAMASGSPMIMLAGQGAYDDNMKELIVEKAPGHWIGVLLSPVPAPLAAHIGSGGLMITNIIKDSPADRAGLQRYDVVVAFDGQKTDDMKDLTEAIADVGIGMRTEIVVVRSSERQKLRISPAKRPDSTDWEYKYDMPDEDIIDQSLKLHGHRLRTGPGGHWIMENLGPMQHVPGVLKELYELHLDDLGTGLDLDDLDIDMKFDMDHIDILKDIDEDDLGARVEIHVEVEDDGQATTIRRDADGKIHINRVDPDGNESSDIYENEEEFENKDPENYQLYQRSTSESGIRHRICTRVLPKSMFGKARRHFQIEVEKKLQDALDESQAAQAEAKVAVDEARKLIMKKVRQRSSGENEETLSVKIGDGKITVTRTEGNQVTDYIFDDEEEFKQSEPELYEKFKSLFE